VLHHVLSEGARLQVESLIGYVLAPGEAVPSAGTNGDGPKAPAAVVADPGPRAAAPDGVRASPIAKRLAREHGLDLASITGTGPDGRIVESDVRTAIGAGAAATADVAADAGRDARRVPLSVMRRSIGERLRRSVDTAVSLTLTREVRAEVLVAARTTLAERLDAPVPYDAFFVKALAEALRAQPDLNATVEGSDLVVFTEINIGVAVALEAGLIVPVVRGADRWTISEIGRSIRALGDRAVAGSLSPGDTAGGTATVTNLGGYGIDAFTPVLNPPQALVLGVGRIRVAPVVEDGALAVGKTMVLSLTFDHRVTDGAPAARLLDAIAKSLGDVKQLEGWS
jgi:pyruvate dehydrogenase E2 component (dihydrolipoamide acetyltransferase)